ncbi:MAG: hypothetical protein JSW61_01790, partial [Candidatus Thorarchaeota archaeon]
MKSFVYTWQLGLSVVSIGFIREKLQYSGVGMGMHLSKRMDQLKPSATLAINEQIRRRRAEGEEILHMGFGESPFPVHQRIRKALCENAD